MVRRQPISRGPPAPFADADDTRENADVPLSLDHLVRFCPGIQGGVEWNGAAFSPETNSLCLNNAARPSVSGRIRSTSRLEQEPGPTFCLINPNLDQTGACNIPVFLADIVSFAQTCRQSGVILAQLF